MAVLTSEGVTCEEVDYIDVRYVKFILELSRLREVHSFIDVVYIKGMALIVLCGIICPRPSKPNT